MTSPAHKSLTHPPWQSGGWHTGQTPQATCRRQRRATRGRRRCRLPCPRRRHGRHGRRDPCALQTCWPVGQAAHTGRGRRLTRLTVHNNKGGPATRHAQQQQQPEAALHYTPRRVGFLWGVTLQEQLATELTERSLRGPGRRGGKQTVVGMQAGGAERGELACECVLHGGGWGLVFSRTQQGRQPAPQPRERW